MHPSALPSPLAFVFDRLRAINPSWDVIVGEPEGPLWIRGTDLSTPERGKLRELLDRIGTRLETSNRKIVAAAFALRFGWSSAAAIGPYLVARCVPDLRLENTSLRFGESTLFERAAIHRPRGAMLRSDVGAAHPDVTVVDDLSALRDHLRDVLVAHARPVVDGLYSWSRFPKRAIWGQIFSSWGTPMTQILSSTGTTTAEGAAEVATAFFDDPRPEFAMRPRFYTVTSRGESRAYHRRGSCCLYYKLPKGSLCASCPLLPSGDASRALAGRGRG
ncbi:MAG TPA: (2Fe-2S)-binding protein [Polyangiaceae bacterium]|nr:(2Fe-2S)-binding protein [Polyangiaceae bacterium]